MRDRKRPRWGERRPKPVARVIGTLRRLAGSSNRTVRTGLRELPVALRRGELAAEYVASDRDGDHRRAAAASMAAMERAFQAAEWWQADAWGHRALWHFERAELTLGAVRAARRIGDIRSAAGDPASARRYYAEAIDEARDIGAEREQGLASVGLGRALLDLGDVTTARRLARAARELLTRSDATPSEVEAATVLAGTERSVGESRRGEESS